MHIASASSTVKFHDFPSNTLFSTYQPGNPRLQGPCKSISWCKDGKWLAVVPFSGPTEIIGLKNECKLLHTIVNISEPSCASFQNLVKRNIAVGTGHGQVLLYDIKSRNVRARYPRTSSAITHVGFNAKDTHCYAGCANGEVWLFNTNNMGISCKLRVPKSSSLSSIKAHAQKRNYLIGASNEGIVAVWDTNTSKSIFCDHAHNAPITSAIFSPINTAIIVSAGMDRQVCIYDIESRQRITNIPVDNNIMSIDFVEDAMYIAMGSQNGKIHIYDSRKLPKPLHSFDAHNSSIRHLITQPGGDEVGSSNSSLASMPFEEVVQPKQSDAVDGKKKRTSDFFGILSDMHPVPEDSLKGSPAPVTEGGDSFMQALGIASDSSMQTSQQEDNMNYEISLDLKRQSLGLRTPNPPLNTHEKFGLSTSKNARHTTSTPVLPGQHLAAGLSPVISSSTNQNSSALPGLTIADVQNMVKDFVQDEVKKSLQELETNVSYVCKSNAALIRRMLFDMHMSNVKDFSNLEKMCDTLAAMIREEFYPEPSNNREITLMEENMLLKKRILELESQLGNNKVESDVNMNSNQ